MRSRRSLMLLRRAGGSRVEKPIHDTGGGNAHARLGVFMGSACRLGKEDWVQPKPTSRPPWSSQVPRMAGVGRTYVRACVGRRACVVRARMGMHAAWLEPSRRRSTLNTGWRVGRLRAGSD